MHVDTREPLIPADAIPETIRISKGKFFGAVGLLVIAGLIGAYAYIYANFFYERTPKQLVHTQIPEGQVQGVGDVSNPLRLPKSYGDMPLAEERPVFVGQEPLVTKASTNGVVHPARDVPSNPFKAQEPPALPSAPPLRQPPVEPAGGQPPKPAAPKADKPKPSTWLLANLKETIGEPPFPVPKDEETKQGQLFPKATHEKPENPLRVIYPSQIINGLLQNDINSDHPGPVRILVAEELTDRWGQGQVLIPQYSTILGSQETARVAYGQSRVGISLTSIELPDGSMIALKNAKAGDMGGATGLSGKVNNHYISLGVAAVLQAFLSVGSRSMAGNPRGYQPNIAQDATSDVSKSINTTGQEIIKRELDIPPTIEIRRSTPVTLQLTEPINLQADTVIVR